MKIVFKIFSLLIVLFLVTSCSSVVRFSANTIPGTYGNKTKTGEQVDLANFPDKIVGKASYYGQEFESRKTANGEIYSGSRLTAAHRELPFGTYIRVKNRRNNREVIVKVNDRGPFVSGRILDLSYSAAEQLDMVREGVAEVEIEILGQE